MSPCPMYITMPILLNIRSLLALVQEDLLPHIGCMWLSGFDESVLSVSLHMPGPLTGALCDTPQEAAGG